MDANVHYSRAVGVGEEQRVACVGASRHVVGVRRHLHKRGDVPAESQVVGARRFYGDCLWRNRTCGAERRTEVQHLQFDLQKQRLG